MLAVIGIIYGALVAMVQPDLKKLVAYSSVSHLGFVVLGLCALNVNGVQGAVYQMLNHGVSTGGLFMIVGMLSDRRHTRLISEFGGLKAVMPRLVAVLPARSRSRRSRCPATNGFIGEFLILLGSFRVFPRLTVFAATGVILSAVYMLWMFQRVNYGEVTNEKNRNLPDLSAARVGADDSDDRPGHLHGRRAGLLPEARWSRRSSASLDRINGATVRPASQAATCRPGVPAPSHRGSSPHRPGVAPRAGGGR